MGIASGKTIMEAPMTQRLSLTDRSTCREGPGPFIYHSRPPRPCCTMPMKVLEKRLRVAVTGTDGRDLSLAASDTAQEIHTAHQPRAPKDWADLMEEVEPIPPLFEDVFRQEGDDDADGETGSDILKLDDMEEGEEDSTFPMQSRPPSSTEAAGPVDNNLYEAPSGQAAAPSGPGLHDRDESFWSSPFKSKVTTQGYSKLEVHGMAELGLAEPPAVEPSLAYHLHLSVFGHLPAR
ncbi:hypothetical protein D5F01_LYC23699 [Larimichthys crocea]|uniref:Uncharacterized protein n=1 Tax=Larimichthys crocea TaxID=215358 RepID=A0A6G0HG47_LARCR|nr:hypothetical protein D5F01_LYC23699 [Larimichthys crocea]